MSEQGDGVEERAIRSVAACNACRAKKQKCSGEKPSCARCQTLHRECIWPQKQKRGPAKGYIEALETRLCDTEEVLSRLLAYLSVSEACEALLRSNHDSTIPSRSYSSLLLPDRKQAVEVWTGFPLKTADDVLRWHRERGKVDTPKSNFLQHPRRPADVRSAASCGDVFEGRRDDLRLQSVDGFETIGQREEHIHVNVNISTMGEGPSTIVDGQGHWQSSSGQSQSSTQRLAESTTRNGSLGLSREFQEGFLW